MKSNYPAFDFKKAKRGSLVNSYAFVRSSNGDKIYTVAKYNRTRKYICTCPDFVFRLRKCKHIVAFQHEEDLMRLRKLTVRRKNE